jgi:hypothetical protein
MHVQIGRSEKLQSAQAGVTVAPDDDVVVERDAEGLAISAIWRVTSMSARDGVGSPLG